MKKEEEKEKEEKLIETMQLLVPEFFPNSKFNNTNNNKNNTIFIHIHKIKIIYLLTTYINVKLK